MAPNRLEALFIARLLPEAIFKITHAAINLSLKQAY